MAVDLGLSTKQPVDLDLDSPPPFHYVADGRDIGLSPVSGEILLGTRRELDFGVADLFTANPVVLGIAVDPEVNLGVSREVQIDTSWIQDIRPLSNRLVSLKIAPTADWNAGLADLLAGLDDQPASAANSPASEDFWTAPVLMNAESGLRQWVTDEVIVMLDSNIDPESFFSDSHFDGYRSLLGTTDQFIAKVRNATGLETLEFSNNVLPTFPGVVWATVNFVAEARPDFTPNDPFYILQWHLNNTGQSVAKVDADIDADLAWDVVKGDAGVVVAIIDDGFQTSHPDLEFWVNPNEPSTPNGIDNDNNGWIDDINGLNLVDSSPTTDNLSLNDPNPTTQFEKHGTAVAGSAATRGNNFLGVASPAYGTKIMGLKPYACTDSSGSCSTSFEAVAKTVYYAAGRTADGIGTWRGADVINISYSMSPNSADTTAFNWATANGRNGLGTPVFASTGNDASGAEYAEVELSLPASLDQGAQVQFRYSKDGSVVAGDDRVWINWLRYPDATVERFDNVADLPDGWFMQGDVAWNFSTNPETERAYGTGRYPIRSGAIDHNQTSGIATPEINSSGTLSFRYWVSTEQFFDKLEVLVRYKDFFGDWGDWAVTNFTTFENGSSVNNFSASGIAEFTPNAHYPSNLDSVIGVGASTDWDYKAAYSQYGPGLDFVAPSGGGNVNLWTTDRTGSAGYEPSSDYAAVAGTSFSSPLAAGVGALMLSRNPNLTAAQLRTIMQNTAEEIGSVSYPGGVNEFYGHGRINAHQAVLAAGVDSNDRISNASAMSMNSTVNGRLTTTIDVNMYQINVNGGERVSIDLDHFAPDANTDTFLRVFDSAGVQLAVSDDTAGPNPETSTLESYVEFTAPSNGAYYIGVSSFGNQNYNAVTGAGKTSATTPRLGNYQLRVNNVTSSMLLVNLNSDNGDERYFNGVTLREAIAFANQSFTGPTIQFDTAGVFSTPQTINLTPGFGSLPISRSMSINGANRVTVNAQGSSRVFNIDDNSGSLRNVNLTGMTIRGGNASTGGGILNRESLSLTEVLVTQNTATDQGGGIWNAGDLTVSRSVLTNNTSTNRGGGIYQQSGTANVIESTLSGNVASQGGGVANFAGTANIHRSTVTLNQTGIWSEGNIASTVTNVQGSIVSGNISEDVVRDGAFLITIASQGFNIVGNGTAISAFFLPTDQVGVNPLLGAFTNNGGPLSSYSLLPGSPAINRGNPDLASPPAFDQRGTGFPRIRGGVIDVGAFEAHPPVVEVLGNVTEPNNVTRNYNLRDQEVVFYQFTLTSSVQASNNQSLVIDTLGSSLTPNNDTEIGLYDSNGNLLARNDDYTALLSRLGFGDTDNSFGDLAAGTYYLAIAAYDTTFGASGFDVTSISGFTGNVEVNIDLDSSATSASIVGSFVNHVGYTGSGSSIDSGKSLAKESASPTLLNYNNLINSSNGIRGLAFDVLNLAGTVTAADFVFQMSPTGLFNEGANPVAGWVAAPAPSSVTVTPGAPARINLTWPNNAIANRWLRVTVLANANTGLASNEVYYVGHLLGETTGPSGSSFTVAFADLTPIRNVVGSTVNSSSIADIDKNGVVAFADISAARTNIGAQLTIITIPASGNGFGLVPTFDGTPDGDLNKRSGLGQSEWTQTPTPLTQNEKLTDDIVTKRRRPDFAAYDDFFANF